jgi:hypothetical protein
VAAAKTDFETRMSNIEQGIPNDEVKAFLPFPLIFGYSIFCGSLLDFYAACVEVTD